ncbi:MAG: LysR family transcriptional regulator [Pontibacterium sp.]
MLMDTPSLLAFVTVAHEASFSKAAQKLFITQSAISKRVAQLEEQLEASLFDRIGRGVSLTEAGKQLLPRAERIIAELDDAKRAISNLTEEVAGELNLAASHHISLHRLPPILRQFCERYPQVKLNLRFDESELAYQSVLKGDLEMALITLAPDPDEKIHSQTLWRDRLHFVAAQDHPLAAAKHLNLKELTSHSAILPSKVTFTRQLVEALFERHQLSLNAPMSTNYLDTIRMMVSIGLGWSLLPESLINDDLATLPVEAEAIYRELGVIRHKDRTLSNAANHLLAMLKTSPMDGV